MATDNVHVTDNAVQIAPCCGGAMANSNVRFRRLVGVLSLLMSISTSLFQLSHRVFHTCGQILGLLMRSITLHSLTLRIQLGSTTVSFQRNGDTGNITVEVNL